MTKGTYTFPILEPNKEYAYSDIKVEFENLLKSQKVKIDKCIKILKQSKCNIISDVVEPYPPNEDYSTRDYKVANKRVITYSSSGSKLRRPAKSKRQPQAKPDKDKTIYRIKLSDGSISSVVGKEYQVETDKTSGKSLRLMTCRFDIGYNLQVKTRISDYRTGIIMGSGSTSAMAYRDAHYNYDNDKLKELLTKECIND